MRNQNDVRLPECEVRITAGSFDVFVMALYAGKDIHAPYEAVCSIVGKAESQALVQILQDAINVLRADGWRTLAQLDSGSPENEKSPPF